VESELLSVGWSLNIYDCAGAHLYTVTESVGLIRGADLTVTDWNGRTIGTSSYDWSPVGTNKMTITAPPSIGDGAVLGWATSDSLHVGTQEWQIFANGFEGSTLANDKAVSRENIALLLGTIAAYKTWADKSCSEKKHCTGDFKGTCSTPIEILEIIVLGLLALFLTVITPWLIRTAATVHDACNDVCCSCKRGVRRACDLGRRKIETSAAEPGTLPFTNPAHNSWHSWQTTTALSNADWKPSNQWQPVPTSSTCSDVQVAGAFEPHLSSLSSGPDTGIAVSEQSKASVPASQIKSDQQEDLSLPLTVSI